jgi:hypothetical protein
MTSHQFIYGIMTLFCGAAILAWCILITEGQVSVSIRVYGSFFQCLSLALRELLRQMRMSAFLTAGVASVLYIALSHFNFIVSSQARFEQLCRRRSSAPPPAEDPTSSGS